MREFNLLLDGTHKEFRWKIMEYKSYNDKIHRYVDIFAVIRGKICWIHSLWLYNCEDVNSDFASTTIDGIEEYLQKRKGEVLLDKLKI